MKGPIDIKSENRQLGDVGKRAVAVGLGIAVVGAALTAFAFTTGGTERLLWSYLVNYVFCLSLALGALFFVMIQHVTHAGWSVVVRRLAEAVAANLPVLALLALPIIFGAGTLYHWTHPGNDPVLQAKVPYLNHPFFVARLVIYFAIWSGFAVFFFRSSVKQDTSGDPALTLSMERWAAPGIVLFALSCSFAAFDLLMSLDPHWYSTIFGVYFFAGSLLGFLALLSLIALRVQSTGRLTHAITTEHYHDLGKFTFAFVVFWAYIAFSQFLLIWYGNLPEETIWYQRRLAGGWGTISAVLLFGHFVLPFLALMSRFPKRRPATLALFSAWLIAMHWIDLYWLAMPEMNHKAEGVVPWHVGDFGLLLLLVGIFWALTARRLSSCSLIAEGDPRLVESLTFENV